MWLVFALDILIILPLGIFKKTKGASAIGLVVSSYVYGLTLWFWALLLTYIIWGVVAVFIGLFIAGVGVDPIAMLATAIKGEWSITGQIVLLLVQECWVSILRNEQMSWRMNQDMENNRNVKKQQLTRRCAGFLLRCAS